jgi:hypothetical protein
VLFPQPVPGLVLRYSYLWRAEQRRGQEEGVKDRPCAVVLVTAAEDSGMVAPSCRLHTPPPVPEAAVEIPSATKERLRLDAARSWVVLTEANRFVWPGPDLRPLHPGDVSSVAYGLLPYGLMERIRRKFLFLLKERRTGLVARTE